MVLLLPWLFVAAGVLLLNPKTCLCNVDIEGNLFLPDGSSLSERTPLYLGGLHGAQYTTFSRASGSFVFQDVLPGVYSLEVGSITHAFPAAKVKVPDRTGEEILDGTVKVIEYSFPGAKGNNHAAYPIQLQAHSEWEYFTKKEGLNIFGLLKSPMVLLLGFSVIMMFVLPKLMDNVDPETKKELEKMQAEGGIANAFKRATSEAAQSSEVTAAPQRMSQTMGTKKKRT